MKRVERSRRMRMDFENWKWHFRMVVADADLSLVLVTSLQLLTDPCSSFCFSNSKLQRKRETERLVYHWLTGGCMDNEWDVAEDEISYCTSSWAWSMMSARKMQGKRQRQDTEQNRTEQRERVGLLNLKFPRREDDAFSFVFVGRKSRWLFPFFLLLLNAHLP